MKSIVSIFAIALMLCSCAQQESGPVYQKPQPNPTKVVIEQLGQTTQVSISWQDNASDELGYAIWVNSGSAAARIVAELPADSQYYLIESGLVAGTSYNIGVQARGTEDKLSSAIIYKEINIFDWSRLPSAELLEDVVVTPSSVALDYKFRKSSDYEITRWGLCWSADHTPTLEDAWAHGPNATSMVLRQAIPVSAMEYGKTYKVRCWVECSKGVSYSNEVEVSLGEEVPAVTFNWTRMQVEGLHEDVEVYCTTDPLHGRAFNAWYAIADVTKGNVEFRMQFVEKAQRMSVFYQNNLDAGETAYVLTNAGYFNMSTGTSGDYCVDKGTVTPSTSEGNPKGTFGVDANQKPFALWAGKGMDGVEYFYEHPRMNLGNSSLYGACAEDYPWPSVSVTPYYAMAAGPMLVKNGKVIPDVTKEDGVFVRNYEGVWTDIFNDDTVTPDRTCVGYTEDGKIVLFVCDGRIKASQGASIVEAAQIMKGLGCVGAVNFDGGGSTAMLVQGDRVNSYESNTSGATEDRAVGSVMGFFLKK
ncbi:MAG: phosphodiester glycosidase family protein [Candidatus Cryptobacteroides sp.]